MTHFYQSAFFEALGWSLIDSLWQMGSLWFIYQLITLNGSKYSAAMRHNLAMMAIVLGTCWFAGSIIFYYLQISEKEALFSLSYSLMRFDWSEGSIVMQSLVPYLSSIYILLVAWHLCKLVASYRSAHLIFQRNHTPVGEEIASVMDPLKEKAGVRKKVKIALSTVLPSPLTIGFFKPLILLPVSVLSQLTPAQVEAVIMHELLHIRRNDYLKNVIMTTAQVVLFFNPFMKILAIIVRKERENSCDDGVLEKGFSVLDYSQALYYLGKSPAVSHQLVLAATGPEDRMFLLQRVKRLLKIKTATPSILRPLLTFFLCLSVGFFAGKSGNEKDLVAEPTLEKVQLIAVAAVQSKTIAEVTPVTERTKTPPPASKNEQNTMEKKVPKPSKTPAPKAVLRLYNEAADHKPVVITRFVDVKKQIEFTIIDAHPAAPPAPVIGERRLPYVPSSTFYCPLDSANLPARKVVNI